MAETKKISFKTVRLHPNNPKFNNAMCSLHGRVYKIYQFSNEDGKIVRGVELPWDIAKELVTEFPTLIQPVKVEYKGKQWNPFKLKEFLAAEKAAKTAEAESPKNSDTASEEAK